MNQVISSGGRLVFSLTFLVTWACALSSLAQTPPAPAPAQLDAERALGVLREGLIDSFNKQDIDGLLSYVAPDVVVTWQNGEVCRGPAEVKAYYQKMMSGNERIVARATADPKVDGRQVYGDWAVSFGHMNDHFFLTDGSDLPLNSRFTATINRQADRWLITAFHVSANLFENPVLGYAAKKGAAYGALAGGGGGLAIGVLLAIVWARVRGTTSNT
jgi:ketosteroid isomerase-like protein